VITARLFARLREQAGTGTEELELPASRASVADVYAALRERHPALESNLALIRPARNQSFVEWTDQVIDGDEVAFIPPVSGGTPGDGPPQSRVILRVGRSRLRRGAARRRSPGPAFER
jgi:molybdopterin converting factor subunit 1